MPSRNATEPTSARTGAYFERLYAALGASPAHARIGREALGDGFAGQLGYAGAEELRRLAEVAGVSRGRRILELCCGAGGVSAWLSARTGAHVVGLDCAVAAPGRSASPGSRDGPLIAADVQRLPLRAAAFDGAYCIDGWGADIVDLATAAARLLRPGGSAAFLVSLPAGEAESATAALRAAGHGGAFWEDRTAAAAVLLRRWLAAYRRHERDHIAEVGERYHRALVDEIDGLLAAYARGETERVLLVVREAR